jgi:hypothetical protein
MTGLGSGDKGFQLLPEALPGGDELGPEARELHVGRICTLSCYSNQEYISAALAIAGGHFCLTGSKKRQTVQEDNLQWSSLARQRGGSNDWSSC